MSSATKYTYFASDFHLGTPDEKSSRAREKTILSWLDHIEKDAEEIFLIGDIFDFWFEYKTVVPKGFVRLQAKIAYLVDIGIPVHFFKGNHDMWMFHYFQEELGVQLHADEYCFEKNGKRFFVAHGDGLGPGDYKYKFIKRVFRNPLCQWAFARIHPNFGISLANFFSRSSRKSGMSKDMIYAGKEQEWLYQFCQTEQHKNPYDFYIFGHRHLPLFYQLEKSVYVNTGEWLYAHTFARFDGKQLEMFTWKNGEIEAYDATKPN
ncbi:MAG: UDP-2,3-diacylglucosamine diphosphatase [Flavobacteriales bacterium]